MLLNPMIYERYLKRAFDITAGSALLIVAAIPLGLVATFNAAYHRENPFYLRDRIGRDGKPFGMLKLRSMKTMNDEHGNPLPDLKRRTPFGRLLRFTALDECPQLINVIKGDMSIVGPRPRTAPYVDSLPTDIAQTILSVRPGLTGPWQVFSIGRKSQTSWKERNQIDADYVRHGITFQKDMSYLLRSFPAFYKGHDGEDLKRKPQ